MFRLSLDQESAVRVNLVNSPDVVIRSEGNQTIITFATTEGTTGYNTLNCRITLEEGKKGVVEVFANDANADFSFPSFFHNATCLATAVLEEGLQS